MLHSWLRKLIGESCAPIKSHRRADSRLRLFLEVLEDRVTPSSFLVTNTSNDFAVAGSLPFAVANANADTSGGPVTITFDSAAGHTFATAQTITLKATLDLNNTHADDSITIDGPAAGVTIRSGGLSATDFSLVRVESGTTAVLDGLTISDGFIQFNATAGAGINNSGNLTVSHSTIQNNLAVTADGSGIFNAAGATLTVTSTVVYGNRGGGQGGGIANRSILVVSNSTFENNSSQQTGGGISNSGTAWVDSSTFTGNYAEVEGAGIGNNVGTLSVTHSTFTGNRSFDGAALCNATGAASFLTVAYCTIYGNKVDTSGDGLGGGISNRLAATLTVLDTTISGNTASGLGVHGGGIFNEGTLALINTIVAGNSAWAKNDIDGSGVAIAGGHNLVGDATGLTGTGIADGQNGNIVGHAALLAQLGNNGGPTQTVALLPGSPALSSAAGIATLASPIGSSDTTITVNAVFPIPAPPPAGEYEILIGGERMKVTAVTGSTLTVTRGAAPASHNAGDAIFLAFDQRGAAVPGLAATDMGAYQSQAPVITFTPPTLPSALAGAIYNQRLSGNGGTAPYSQFVLVAGALPEGLTLSTSGTISGTPTEAGSFNFTVKAQDSTAGPAAPYTGSQDLSLTVNAPNIVFTPANLPAATAGGAYNQTLSAGGGTAQYSSFTITAGALPAGLALSTSGVISGIPTAAGSFSFTIRAQDSTTGPAAPYTGSQNFSLTVSAPRFAFTPANLPAANAGAAYLQTLNASGGTAPYANFTVSAGALPAGLTLSSDGTVSGLPTGAGTFSFTVRAQDSTTGPAAPYAASQNYSLVLNAPVGTLPFTDTFARANSPLLGTSWTVLTGSIPVQNNAGRITSNAAGLALVNGVTRADVTLQVDATLPTVGSQVGLIARQSGPGDTNEYLARLLRTGTATYRAQIYRFSNGSALPALADTDVSAFPGVGLMTTIQLVVVGNSLKFFVGTGANNLAAFATDSSIARGAIGVRGSMGTTIDNFMASDVAVAAPVLPDDFSTSSASNQLDANWEDRVGNFSVVHGQAKATQPAADLSVLRNANYADVVVSADINLVAGQRAGLVARYQGNGDNTMYLGEIDDRTGTRVAKIALSTGPNNFVILNTSTIVPGLSGNLRFVVNGNSLQLFLGNTLLTFATDTTLTQGSVGIRGNATTTFDNFNAAAAPIAQASLGFTDPFAPTADGQLQAVWQIRRGDFQVNAATAVGQDPQPTDASPNNPAKINLAVLAGHGTATDVDVNAVVNVAPGQQAGLVLRYLDDRDYYLGVLDNSSGTPMVQIFVNRNGVLSQLAPVLPAQVIAPSNGGTLDFQAVGGTLQLSLNSTLLISVTNDVLRAGSVGIRSSATTYQNFSVAAAASVIPFTDNFSVDGSLSTAWTTVRGTWVVESGAAAGAPRRNEAILPGVNSTDVVVSADVNVLSGQIAGLVARYSGAGDTNNYLGALDNSTGAPLAQIFYVDATGAYNKIAEAPASGTAGTLRFEVVGSSLRLFLNGTPQVAAFNTVLTQGAVGMRGSAITTFGNFNAMAVPAVPPFNDNFSAGSSLRDSWLNEVGNFTVVGGTANGATALNVASLPGVNATDVVLTLDVNVDSGQQAGLIARHLSIGNGSYYLGRIINATGSPRAQILRINGGIQLTLADVPATGNVGTLRFEVVDTSLRLFLTNTLQTFATDTTRTNGSVGMRTSNTSVDNFNATAYVPAAAGPGFSDSFSAGNAQGQLADTWATRVGDFTVAGGLANGKSTGVNLAVLGGVSVADVDLTVDVALAAGRQAGLVAHYNGTGDNSMYVAMLDNTSGTPAARIIRIAATGQQSVLGSAAAPSGTGTLRFRIVGSSLQLLLNATLLVDVIDFNPLATGSVGIRGSATTFDNFTAA